MCPGTAGMWRSGVLHVAAMVRRPIGPALKISRGADMIKAAFFDIDGTLVGFKTHRVAESTWRAIELMRARGVRVVIASGRSVAEMQEEL